jgi:hypothetical protein
MGPCLARPAALRPFAIRNSFPLAPWWISHIELAHTLFGVVLILLIALALRNQFKIK